jgi:quinol monooxygenase YgiN
MIIRIFTTAVEPEEVGSATQMFNAEVQPVFNEFDGCLGIDWYIGVDEHSGDLVDAMAISRWESVDAIEKATGSSQYVQALANLRRLFRQSPIVHHYRSGD